MAVVEEVLGDDVINRGRGVLVVGAAGERPRIAIVSSRGVRGTVEIQARA